MEISRSVASAAEGSGAITEGARQVRGVARETADQAGRFSRSSQALIERSDLLMGKVRGFIERIRLADRRAEPREKVTHPVALVAGTVSITGTLADVSAGGAGILADAAQVPAETTDVILKITGVTFDVAARIVGRTPNRINLAFKDPAEGQKVHRWFVASTHRQAA